MVNLDQTTTKIDETWGIASPLPREHIPKRSRPKDQRILRIMEEIKRDGVFSRTQEIEFERASDSRGFGTRLEARESQQRTSGTIAIVCTKNETKIHHKRAQKRRDLIDSKAQRTQGGWGLLSQSNPIQTLTNPWTNSTLKRRIEGGRHRGGGLENRRVHKTDYKSRN